MGKRKVESGDNPELPRKGADEGDNSNQNMWALPMGLALGTEEGKSTQGTESRQNEVSPPNGGLDSQPTGTSLQLASLVRGYGYNGKGFSPPEGELIKEARVYNRTLIKAGKREDRWAATGQPNKSW